LTRYFPELVEALRAFRAMQFVLDGEIVIPSDGNLSFDDLLMRIHPAASRVAKLSKESPCRFIVFDLLVDASGKNLANLPLHDRRRVLEAFIKKFAKKKCDRRAIANDKRHRPRAKMVPYGNRARRDRRETR
jgi:ATP-dependent DNA ligase